MLATGACTFQQSLSPDSSGKQHKVLVYGGMAYFCQSSLIPNKLLRCVRVRTRVHV